MVKTIEELKELYDKMEAVYDKKVKPIVFNPLPDDTIIDPDQTVNWNRQTVALYNEALEKNKQNRLNEIKTARQAYEDAYYDFVINNPKYGDGKITKENVNRMRSFMYDYREDDYNYSNGFYNHMCTLKDLVHLWLHTY